MLLISLEQTCSTNGEPGEPRQINRESLLLRDLERIVTRLRLRAFCAFLFAFAVLGCAGSDRTRQLPQLVLEETGSISIPRDFRVAGARLYDSEVLLWGNASGAVLSARLGTKAARVGENVLLQPVAAAILENGDIQVVDAGRREIVQFTRSGGLVKQSKLDSMRDIQAAHHAERGWVIRGHNRAGQPVFMMLDKCELAACSVDKFRVDRFGRDEPVFLTGAAGGVIPSYVNPPFGSFLADVGKPIIAITPALPTGTWWVGMPVLALDRGFVWTLADLKSNTRWLALLDSDRIVVRTKEMNEPIAFLATDPQNRKIAAILDGDAYTNVIYRWHWKA